MADTNENIYFAGFFDGEGSVAIYSRKYVVSLTNTDIRPLRRAQELWGGAIALQKRGGKQVGVQDIHRWQIYGHGSRSFLEAIQPFTMIKSDQIAAYIAALDVLPKVTHGSAGHGQETWKVINDSAQKLRSLKRAGASSG
jgi:hypothetical protein